MFRAYQLLFLTAIVLTLAEGNRLLFLESDDVYDFYGKWIQADTIEAFREKQVKFAKQLMNPSVDPCEDFYEFACGNFESVVRDNVDTVPSLIERSLRGIQEKLFASEIRSDESEASFKLKTFYQSCMNSSTQDREPLKDFIERFADWPLLQKYESSDDFDWLNVTAYAALYNVRILFETHVSPTTDVYRAEISYAYDDIFKPEVTKEKAEVLSIDLSGKEHELLKVADFVEKVLALHSPDNLGPPTYCELRDLKEKLPAIDIQRYLQILRGNSVVSPSEVVGLRSLLFFQNLAALIAETDPKVVANYILTQLIHEAANLVLEGEGDYVGLKCSYHTRELLRPALAEFFAERFFDKESERMVENMLDELRSAGSNVVSESIFLTPEIKLAALEKTKNLDKIVGASDLTRTNVSENMKREYADIDTDGFFKSYFNAVRQRAQNEHKKVGQSIQNYDPNPLSTIAYYAPSKMAVIVEAGILQPPLFHKFSPMHMNYGGIGAILGHELMHAFDVEGVLFDKEGDAGITKINSSYHSRIGCYRSQYNELVLEKFQTVVDGDTNVREGVADNEGLKVALHAYKKWLLENEDPSVIGFDERMLTPLQTFFLAFGQSHCAKYSENMLRFHLQANHAPAPIRVIGALSNIPEFAEAYYCPGGSGMNPEHKCDYF